MPSENTEQRKLAAIMFTDMVGSTQLKQDLGDREALALIQRHHAVVRKILVQFKDGEEISTAGDSFFLVFGNPSDGVRVLRDPRRIWRIYCAGTRVEPTEAGAELARRIAAVDFEPRDWLPRGFAELQRAA